MKAILPFIIILLALPFRTQAQNKRTFEYTGNVQQFKIPKDVTSIEIELLGGGGGNSIWENEPYSYYKPGQGGSVKAKLSVKPGQVIYIYVGGKGGDAKGETPGKGGFNGGGKGATSENGYGPYSGGGGGGASDIRIGGTDLKYRVIIAGGGGGAAANYPSGGDHGGNGGGLVASDGQSNFTSVKRSVGEGGTQESGGIGGHFAEYDKAEDGRKGFGGNAPNKTSGGGGGGGYFGGGAGCWTGGGGGSSYSYTKASNVVHKQGINEKNGIVIISFNSSNDVVDCSGASVTATTSKSVICEGESIRLIGHGADTYTWNKGVQNNVAFEPDYGKTTYIVTGKSQGGECIRRDSILIIVNNIEIQTKITYDALSGLGIANVEVIGFGQSPFSYNWNDESENNEGHFEQLKTGGYQVEVSDANGCVGRENITISQREAIDLNVDTDHNNGHDYSLTARTNEDQSFVTVKYKGAFEFQIVDKGNNVVRNGHAVDSKKVDISTLPAGTYKVQLIFKTVKEEVSFTKY